MSSITIFLPKNLKQAFKIKAVANGKTMTEILEDFIKSYLEEKRVIN